MNRMTLLVQHSMAKLKPIMLVFAVAILPVQLYAQAKGIEADPAARQGHIHFMDQKYDQAINYFKRVKSPDTTIYYMQGYSQYQIGDYEGSIGSFTKVIDGKPTKNLASTYYYRGKAKNTLAQGDVNMSDKDREQLLKSSIDDFTQAISLNGNETSYYLNRGIAYRDLGILRGTDTAPNYDKHLASDYYQKGIDDLQLVFSKNSKREDIAKEIKKVSIYKESLK